MEGSGLSVSSLLTLLFLEKIIPNPPIPALTNALLQLFWEMGLAWGVPLSPCWDLRWVPIYLNLLWGTREGGHRVYLYLFVDSASRDLHLS